MGDQHHRWGYDGVLDTEVPCLKAITLLKHVDGPVTEGYSRRVRRRRLVHAGWEGAVAAIRRTIACCDEEDRTFVSSVGVELPASLPLLVAAARVRSAVVSHFGFAPSGSTDVQQEILAEMAAAMSVGVPAAVDSYEEAEAWIRCLYLKQRLQSLEQLRLAKGDVVSRNASTGRFDEVSSIGDDGQVWFTGGRGARAWPDQLTVIARHDDSSADSTEARQIAKNRAAERARTKTISREKLAALKPYAVTDDVTGEDIEELRRVIDEATCEKPIQELLEERPQLLASLLRGPSRYCRPKVHFGDKYVADFLLADIDSTGIRWVLVELETPDSCVVLKTKDQFDHQTRTGVAQINDWRRWIGSHHHQAHRPRDQNGYGLPDIRKEAEGIVLVGRRHKLRRSAVAADLRNEQFDKDRITIQTYDRLLEQLEGTLRFSGPWSANPYSL